MSNSDRFFSFYGVTTGSSLIMRVFPRWAEHLGLEGVQIAGTDLPIHADPEIYRERVLRLKRDPAELGALVTTHKIDLYRTCRDLFEYVDPLAELCGETSCLSKRDGHLRAHAKDPISAGQSLDTMLPKGYWKRTGAEVLCLGAGGSVVAIALHLVTRGAVDDRPRQIIVANRSQPRLDALHQIVVSVDACVPVKYVCNQDPKVNDALMGELTPGSLVINGTGMGKDTPGSPLTDHGTFPRQGVVWELNYRGELEFLRQARVQERAQELLVHDGWPYFIYGWTAVIEEVFDITLSPADLTVLTEIADEVKVTTIAGASR